MSAKTAVGVAAVLLLTVMLAAPLIGLTWRKMRKIGLGFIVIAAGFLHSMATKPTIVWDDYLRDNGSKWTTNTAGVVTGVDFEWAKTNATLPSAQTLYIARSPTNETDWTVFVTTTVGEFSHIETLTDAEGYKFWVYHDWCPPSPVHTNGVWLGNVIERANGARGVEKMVIIKGQLMKDGKVIAP